MTVEAGQKGKKKKAKKKAKKKKEKKVRTKPSAWICSAVVTLARIVVITHTHHHHHTHAHTHTIITHAQGKKKKDPTEGRSMESIYGELVVAGCAPLTP